MNTEIPADDADARARAQWQRNKWTIAVDLGMDTIGLRSRLGDPSAPLPAWRDRLLSSRDLSSRRIAS